MAIRRVFEVSMAGWQNPVLAIQNTPPASPAEGDRYIVGTSPTGVWAGQANKIAWYFESAWHFDTPLKGMFTFVKNIDKLYYYTGSTWDEWSEGTGDMLKSVYDTDNNGIVDKAEMVDDGTHSATAEELEDAVSKAHTRNKDTKLDEGGANEITAAQAKEAYQKRGVYYASLGEIHFDL